MGVVQIILRAFQLLFAIVVLGVSVNLARNQALGAVPIRTGFSAAAGALGMVTAAAGLLALVFAAIPDALVSGLDALAGLVFLGGGLGDAVGVGGTNCNDWAATSSNELLNGGVPNVPDKAWLKKRCTAYKADTAFMFLGAIVCAALLGWVYLKGSGSKRTRRSGIAV